ncbi:hypothetical protein BDV96DRAFT_599683 [Lophiotrema nucula]|uniref:Uncharacterized protein n=1 Tax=Lophiotrema nucula TaxID=690887 RepID=A0A6A5ZAB4_9PLEO|nr:hypothetical protein BDV96DRAFT_599683 [Lophiotrema nucula]
MKQQFLTLLPLALTVTALPTVNKRSVKREVPQEHAHDNVNAIVKASLDLNNPDNIQDTIFGLLGAKAAAEGAGNIADADCLQQATADQAFTNAKDAGDVDGMTFALIYRALERNTGSVGLASVPCASLQAVNPEIAALQQHQDPAGDGAQDLNKQIAGELARQIAAIGGDPTLANEASTFAPGEIGDPTAAGNTCDDIDPEGCINSQGLRVDDLSDAELQAALADTSGAGIAAAGNATAVAAVGNNTAQASDSAEAAAPSPQEAQAGGDAAAGAADFGSCTNTDIVFGIPSDGRNEDAFEAADLTNFAHGSALNIKVISSFICDQLVNKCEANQAAVDKCDAANTAASSLKGQAAADAFNQAIAA